MAELSNTQAVAGERGPTGTSSGRKEQRWQQEALWGTQASFTIQTQSAHTTVNYFHVLRIVQMLISSVWAWVIQWRKYVWLTTCKTTGHKHRRHRAVLCSLPSPTSSGNPLTCQRLWLASIHWSHSGVCARTCTHTRVCVCRFELTIRCLPPVSSPHFWDTGFSLICFPQLFGSAGRSISPRNLPVSSPSQRS